MIKAKCINLKKLKKNVLVYCYYSGHGVMSDNYTCALLNVELRGDRTYPLESSLLSLSNFYENCYVVLVLDCCREEWTKEPVTKTISNPVNNP